MALTTSSTRQLRSPRLPRRSFSQYATIEAADTAAPADSASIESNRRRYRLRVFLLDTCGANSVKADQLARRFDFGHGEKRVRHMRPKDERAMNINPRTFACAFVAMSLGALASSAFADTFSYSGAVVTPTITGGFYNISATGAGGGGSSSTVEPSSSTSGGKGATASGTFFLPPGVALQIAVGGAGGSSTAQLGPAAGGGGGGSFVYVDSTPLAVGGGGGGGGGGADPNASNGGDGSATTSGGSGPNPLDGSGGTSGNGGQGGSTNF